ncbi:MAG: hypothetical protein P4L53_26775 [Candidatus Obscuribacterales bacterium]|nr:hypothetical protein [Candidatus Obscuribacterales bacterium]
MKTIEQLQEGFAEINQTSLVTYNRSYDELINEVSADNRFIGQLLVVLESSESISHELRPDSKGTIMEGMSAKAGRSPVLYLLKSLCKYSSNDPELKKRFDDTSRELSENGHSNLTGGTLSTMAVVSLANWICATLPTFAHLGNAALTGIILLIVKVGMDAVCEWLKDNWEQSSNENNN